MSKTKSALIEHLLGAGYSVGNLKIQEEKDVTIFENDTVLGFVLLYAECRYIN